MLFSVRSADRIPVAGGETAKPGTQELRFNHQMKADKTTDIAELNRQVENQVAKMNEIIEKEGMPALKQRINDYNKKVEAEGRAHVKGLPPAGLDPAGKELAWLHDPDMKTGGGPKDVYGTGDRRVNSIIGGQADRLAKEILKMPDTTTHIQPKIVVQKVPETK